MKPFILMAAVLLSMLVTVSSAGAQEVAAVRLRGFYNSDSDGRTRYHMTIYDTEAAAMRVINEWREWEQPIGFVFEQRVIGTVPLYRYRGRSNGDHFFTTSEPEGNQAIAKYDYVPEGICCYISPTPQPGAVPLFRLLWGGRHHYYLTDAYQR